MGRINPRISCYVEDQGVVEAPQETWRLRKKQFEQSSRQLKKARRKRRAEGWTNLHAPGKVPSKSIRAAYDRQNGRCHSCQELFVKWVERFIQCEQDRLLAKNHRSTEALPPHAKYAYHIESSGTARPNGQKARPTDLKLTCPKCYEATKEVPSASGQSESR